MTSIIIVNCQLVIVMIMLSHQFVLSCQLCAFKNVHPCACVIHVFGRIATQEFVYVCYLNGCQFDILLSSSSPPVEESLRAVVQNSRETVALIAAVHTQLPPRCFQQNQARPEKLSQQELSQRLYHRE